MHGLACLILLITISGILGGLIFSLESPTTHSFKWPGAKENSESGMFGHILIGIGGAFVAIAAAILVFRMNLEVFNQPWGIEGITIASPASDQLTLVTASIYVIALSILGGYSGLRMISALSTAGMEKLEEKINGVENKITNLEERGNQVAQNQDLFRVDILLDNNDFQEAIDILEPHTKNNPNDPSGWLLLGYAYKRVDNLEGALNAAQKAISLRPDRWLYVNNLACYMALHGDPIEEVIETLENAAKLAGNNDRFKTGLAKDPDFDNIRNTPEFTKFLDKYVA